MGFKKVYKCLQELFPQIDARALRAVAIEHSKDPDAAVEAVLVEIIPFFDDRSKSSVPLIGSISMVHSPKEAIVPTQLVDSMSGETIDSAQESFVNNVDDGKHQSFHDAISGIGGSNEFFFDSNSGLHEGEGVTGEITLSQNCGENSIETPKPVMLKEENGFLQSEVSVDPETSGADNFPESSFKTSTKKNSCLLLGTLENVDIGVNQIMTLDQERDDLDSHAEAYCTMTANKENDGGQPIPEVDNLMGDPASVTIQDLTTCPSERNVQLIVLSDVDGGDFDDTVRIEDEFTLSESGGIQTMIFLDEIVDDARNNKKILFSTMDSVVSMMKEVELKEHVAEEAKEDASKGDTDVLDKAEELKQMLQYAKEANDMHAGELYGEKAILATELRELQSRLLFLSDEKEKSLAILGEMHQILEVRLAAAENEIKSAEQEKIEKEKFALKALAEHEMDMKKVLREANILKQQAEENAKLREFLMDRGCVVDMLQGEIAVICQDVNRLKENLDQRVPLSKSLSSDHTSFILASSSSSSKSSIPEVTVADQDDLMETPQNIDPATEISTKDCKSILEEDWDLL